MRGICYWYELRQHDEIIATGQFTADALLIVGNQLTIGRHTGIIQTIHPILRTRESRLIIKIDTTATEQPSPQC